jgi:mannose-6-phosphate isomerase-like protein (cupin superfamily)
MTGNLENVSAVLREIDSHCRDYSIAIMPLAGTETWSADAGTNTYYWLCRGDAGVALDGRDEPKALSPGDLLVTDSETRLHVHSSDATFVRLTVRNAPTTCAWAGVHRVRDLPDQSGGCNIAADAFRRLQITWRSEGVTPETPDGDNRVGCHVVWIAEATSRTHYHPVPPLVGGAEQHELYLVLDPAAYGLQPQQAVHLSGVYTYPHPGDWQDRHFTPLSVGDIAFVPADVAHRAVNVLACVIALPGFKPDNDVYVDPAIATVSDDQSAPNEDAVRPAAAR